MEETLSKIPKRNTPDSVRYLSFNVNGCKTLFNYFPWNKINCNFDEFFTLLHADVISLQELKLSPQTLSSVNIGLLSTYRSFISIPKAKKGYSGVGLFVRKPNENDSAKVKNHLSVMKAEEGITGYLKSPDFPGQAYKDIPKDDHIGGYLPLKEEEALKIDHEGRCVVVELGYNIVVFSVYCPANSMGTVEMEAFRMRYLTILFQRCKNLVELGKQVIIMGDINASLDLIDHADTINELVKAKKVVITEKFELDNYDECMLFKSSTPARKLLNSVTIPTIYSTTPLQHNQFLYDTTRISLGRKMGLYTVWNTLTNARQTNYGSRIDYVLTSCSKMAANISQSRVLSHIAGSDHCPIMTDFDVSFLPEVTNIQSPLKLGFEASKFYKLVRHGDISKIFAMNRPLSQVQTDTTLKEKTSQESEKPKYTYTSRKKQKTSQAPINNFFFSNNPVVEAEPVVSRQNVPATSKANVSIFDMAYGKPPLCHHKKPCALKTSTQSKENRGKRFWCCSISAPKNPLAKEDTVDNDTGCGFFQWVQKGN